jgi:hypothetical protein
MTTVWMHGRAMVLMTAAATALLFAACSSDDTPKADASQVPGGPDAAPGAIDASTQADADLSDWLVLNEGSWTVQPGGDSYFCVVKTIQEDTYIKSFQGMSPVGTHHTVLTIYDGTHADGIFPCDFSTNGPSMIYGTGLGTPPMDLPEGVAVKLAKGTKIINNLHLFNATDQPISGTSGTLYKPIDPSLVQHEAEIVLAGRTIGMTVPPGESVQKGRCNISSITASEPIKVFSVAPHMHKLGTHMKSTILRGSQTIVLQDVAYNFDNQTFTLKNPFVELLPGDVLQTDCTYQNTTGHNVTFGESSNNEMCFTNIYYFPRQGATFICDNGPVP